MEPALRSLGKSLADEQDAQLHERDFRAAARARLVRGASPSQTRPARSRLGIGVVFAFAALMAALYVVRPRPLTLSVDDVATQPAVGVALVAPSDAPLPLRFSDGSVVTVSSRSRARVIALDSKGATLVLERGEAHVSVIHREGGRWSIEAGPFEVHVTGTRFDVGWDPAHELLTVKLEDGSVRVSGCGLGEGRRISTGQSVRLSCQEDHATATAEAAPGVQGTEARDVIPSTNEAPGGDTPPSAVASASGQAAVPVRANDGGPHADLQSADAEPLHAREASPAPAAQASWRVLAAGGRYADAYAVVSHSGFARECDTADSRGLLALGNVARFTGHTDEAERALLALRRRFPGSDHAATGAFDLGRIALDAQSDPGKASHWFALYLDERPSGPLARETLGLLMDARQRAGNSAGARDAALSYVRLYPTGPRAELARKLITN